jgi:hypothetical protein
MRSCAILHPLHLELETAEVNIRICKSRVFRHHSWPKGFLLRITPCSCCVAKDPMDKDNKFCFLLLRGFWVKTGRSILRR